MKESLIVFNRTSTNVSLALRPRVFSSDLGGLASHHKRRVVRQGVKTVNVKRSQSLDLVDATGLTIEDIKTSVEFLYNYNNGNLVIIQETHICNIPDDEITFDEEPKISPPLMVPVHSIESLDAFIDGCDKLEKEKTVEVLLDEVVEPIKKEKPKLTIKKKTKKKTKKSLKKLKINKKEKLDEIS